MSRLTTKLVRDFTDEKLKEKVTGKLTVGYGQVIDMIDRFVLVSDTGIGKDKANSIFETRVFRFQCRGRADSLDDAETLANATYVVLDGLTNLDYEDIRILSIECTSKPRQMAFRDTDGRYMFVLEHTFTASKD